MKSATSIAQKDGVSTSAPCIALLSLKMNLKKSLISGEDLSQAILAHRGYLQAVGGRLCWVDIGSYSTTKFAQKLAHPTLLGRQCKYG